MTVLKKYFPIFFHRNTVIIVCIMGCYRWSSQNKLESHPCKEKIDYVFVPGISNIFSVNLTCFNHSNM